MTTVLVDEEGPKQRRAAAVQALVEQLADAEHASWSRWMHYLFSKCVMRADGSAIIPGELVERWKRQAATPYVDLPEREKESDREEVQKIMPLLEAAGIYASKLWLDFVPVRRLEPPVLDE